MARPLRMDFSGATCHVVAQAMESSHPLPNFYTSCCLTVTVVDCILFISRHFDGRI